MHANHFKHTQNSNAQLARGKRKSRKVRTLADEMKSSASLSNDYMGTVLEPTITNQVIQLEQTHCLICNLRTTRAREDHVADILHQTNLKLLAEGLPRIGVFFHCTTCGVSVHKSLLDFHFDTPLHHQNTELRNASSFTIVGSTNSETP